MKFAPWSLLRRLIQEANLVLEVIDVRDPISTRSKRVERLAKRLGKTVVIILNKCDLVPRRVAFKWAELFRREGFKVIYIAAQKRMGTKMLKEFILEIASELPKPVKIAVVGVPKVGKSTVINALKGRHSAPTSPYPGSPGYTKGYQLLKIDEGVYLIDTPGIAPIECGGVEAEIRKRPIEQLSDPVPIAIELMEKIRKYNPKAFERAYGIREDNLERILEEIARKRGWFSKRDKEPLIEEAARAVIRDYFNGKIPFFIPPETSRNKL